MSELKRLEQEALRELAEKARREHDVERVVNAARAYKEVCDALDATYLKDAESALARLFEALAVLDEEV